MVKKYITLPNHESYAYIEKGSKNKPVLILLHGNMSSGVHYMPLIETLQDDFRIIAPDLRGFGDSTYHKTIDSIDDFVDDLTAFCHALNLDRAYLAGWSAGGMVAMRFAAKHPTMIDKLVLIASGSYRGFPIYKKDANYQPIAQAQYESKETMAKDPVQVAPVAIALDQNNAALMKQIWQMAIYNVKTPADDEFDLYLSETMKQRNLVDFDWALMNFNMSDTSNGLTDGDNSIKTITCPILSVIGAKDLAVTRTMFDETAAAVNDVITYVFADAGHSIITDITADLAAKMKSFLL